MEIPDGVKSIDRIALEAAVSRARSMAVESKVPQAPDEVTRALQNFRNKLLLLAAENAHALLDMDSRARPIFASVDRVVNIPGASEKLLPLLEVVQAAVQSIYKQNESLEKDSTDAELLNMASCVATASKRLFDACESARWKLLEAEADGDISARRTKKFSSVKSALDLLHSQAR